MDYLVEIADYPDVQEAVDACGPTRDPNQPEGAPTKPATRAERIRFFYGDSLYAARVWRQLRYCSDYRHRLKEEILRDFEQAPFIGIFLTEHQLRSLTKWNVGRALNAFDVYDQTGRQPGAHGNIPPLLAAPAAGFLRNPREGRAAFTDSLEIALSQSNKLVDDLMSFADERPFVPALLQDIANEETKARPPDPRTGPPDLQEMGKALLARAFGWARPSTDALVETLIGDRALARALAEKHSMAVPFSFVHEQELAEIRRQRVVRLGPAAPAGGPLNKAPSEQASDLNLTGLAFSGGGIRSATFNLGVLQGLANLGLLKSCDYFSTVSGGGYIGSWFAAWTKRLAATLPAQDAANEIGDRLSTARSPNPLDERVRPIRWLREFSNYLTPENSFFSADTWTMVAIYTRNATLNLTILFLFFAALLLLPQIAYWSIQSLFTNSAPWIASSLAALLVIAAGKGLSDSLRLLDPEKLRQPQPAEQPPGDRDASTRRESEQLRASYAGQLGVQLRIVLPLFAAAVIASAGFWVLLHAHGKIFPLWEHPAKTVWTLPGALGRLPRWAVPAAPFALAEMVWQFWLIGNRYHRRWGWQLAGLAIGALASTFALVWQVALDAILLWMSHFSRQGQVSIAAGAITFILLFVVEARGRALRSWPTKDRVSAIFPLGIGTLAAGAVAGALTWVVGLLFLSWRDPVSGLWHAVTLGPPLLLTVLAGAVMFQLGLVGALYPDERREWWGRMRAWVLIYSIGWMAAFLFAIYIPMLWVSAEGWARSLGGWGAAAVWAGSTYAGLRKSRTVQVTVKDGGNPAPRSLTTRIVITVAPYVFITGFLALVSLTIYWTISGKFIHLPAAPPPDGTHPYWWEMSFSPALLWILIVALSLFIVSSLISSRVGVNEFSMHHFYKNRLVRCYLGASRWNERNADLFTGLDPGDDLPLSSLRAAKPGAPDAPIAYPGPYHLVNAAVNLVKGDDLAWQERKASSFVFSPAYCGFDVDRAVMNKRGEDAYDDAYRPTAKFSNEAGGIRLGTAMAISGAAAGSNMGRITTPASSFLMTVFNVRLGWWLGNPRRKGDAWKAPGPTLGLAYALVELLGLTNDRRAFINLSDGGHFENLGIYELVRRRCRFIIASDAGQDGSFAFEDLGNVIRRCRTDFAVEIEMRLDSVRFLDARKWTNAHCAVGEIVYPDKVRGVLVYLKPTITGDEPFDILEYYKRVPEFPHETTADQWFNESQFESYRQLGLHIAEATLGRFCAGTAAVNLNQDFFENLRQFWFPPSAIMAGNTSNLTNDYTEIMERVRSMPSLRFMDQALFPSWPVLAQPASISKRSKRDANYICNSLIQLMENVYFDLDLETNHAHPHVDGWMKLFQYWAKQEVFEEAWVSVRDTYAKRFQSFYKDRVAPH